MTADNTPIIVWIRKDLRLADNPAMSWAASQQKPLIIVVIVEANDDRWSLGAASKWWLHHSLQAFNDSVASAGGKLNLFIGNPLDTLRRVIKESKAQTLVWNRRYEPASIALDKQIKEQLTNSNILVKSFHGNLCLEPWQVQKNNSDPYRVFTAYWRVSQKVASISPVRTVRTLASHGGRLSGLTDLKKLKLLPTLPWSKGFYEEWHPGEAGANAMLKALIRSNLCNYQTARDLPGIDGTSRLSPHLAFGEISPRIINQTISKAVQAGKLASDDNTEAFLREIGWREFAYHLLYHFPATTTEPLDKRFAAFPWETVKKTPLKSWQQGQTGIPLVDAGMRQLWKTGWMHNRVRMVVASLLIKNLGYHWLTGADWFWDTLVDADLASNSMGWQWVAGSGADAAPYFRIFNPVRQGERFDKEAEYVRHWVPEIALLNNKRIHAPWTATARELEDAGVILGKTYPMPVVDLGASRLEALARFDKIKR